MKKLGVLLIIMLLFAGCNEENNIINDIRSWQQQSYNDSLSSYSGNQRDCQLENITKNQEILADPLLSDLDKQFLIRKNNK